MGESPDFWELLERLQTNRLDDQRCSFSPVPPKSSQHARRSNPPDTPKSNRSSTTELIMPAPAAVPASQIALERVLSYPPPYPMIIAPDTGGYWIETGGEVRGQPRDESFNREKEELALLYRRHFLGQEHWNFYAVDRECGPLVVSIKQERCGEVDHLRVILRMKTGTIHNLFPVARIHSSVSKIVKVLNDNITADRYLPVVASDASDLISKYDEHVLVKSMKFGIIHQYVGQTTEEQLFDNSQMSPQFKEFLDIIGTRIKLSEHKGFRGGLDILRGQTGEESVYCEFGGKEVMFHVSSMLPYTHGDPQQLQRKRHIGNDIVGIIFQEGNTPFSPDMITSHFLHSLIVVQPIKEAGSLVRYKVNVAARNDVPIFGPLLPSNPVFVGDSTFRDFLLTKAVNAEMACYKAEKFAQLEMRTRAALLSSLVDDLKIKTGIFMDISNCCEGPQTPTKESVPGSRFIETVKKALVGSRLRAQIEGEQKSPSLVKRSSSSESSLVGNGSLISNDFPKVETPELGRNSLPRDQRGCNSSENREMHSWVKTSDSDSISETSGDVDFGKSSDPSFHLGTSANCFSSMNNNEDSGIESLPYQEPSGVCKNCAETSLKYEDSMKEQLLLNEEATKLKCDKLELLRQNVHCQKEIKRMKEREVQIQTDLLTVSRELNRLRIAMKNMGKSNDPSFGSPV